MQNMQNQPACTPQNDLREKLLSQVLWADNPWIRRRHHRHSYPVPLATRLHDLWKTWCRESPLATRPNAEITPSLDPVLCWQQWTCQSRCAGHFGQLNGILKLRRFSLVGMALVEFSLQVPQLCLPVHCHRNLGEAGKKAPLPPSQSSAHRATGFAESSSKSQEVYICAGPSFATNEVF